MSIETIAQVIVWLLSPLISLIEEGVETPASIAIKGTIIIVIVAAIITEVTIRIEDSINE